MLLSCTVFKCAVGWVLTSSMNYAHNQDNGCNRHPQVSSVCFLISASDLSLGSTLRQLPTYCTFSHFPDLWLFSFLHRTSEIHLHQWMGNRITFHVWVGFHSMDMPRLVYSFTTNGSQSCFQVLAMTNETALNILFLYGHILSFLLGNICLGHVIDM